MRRLAVILTGAVLAGGVAATPAIAGLAGNPSFNHEIPVPAPRAAKAPRFADIKHGDDRGGVRRHAEPGADRSASSKARPSGDRGSTTPEAEPTDDHGAQTPHADPTDGHGGDQVPHAATSDDSGGASGGHGGGRG